MESNYWEAITLWGQTSGIRILIILAIAAVCVLSAGWVAERLYGLLIWRNKEDPEIKKRARTFAQFVRYTLLTATIVVSGMMILDQLGMDIRPVLAGAGVLGLAIGFGAQSLVQDLISGIFILLEDQVRVGDVVNLKGKGGLVEKIGIRTIQLRDFEGAVHFVRNGQIDIITNMTKEFSNYVFDIRVGYDQDPDRVAQMMREIDEELRTDSHLKDDILKPVEIFGIERLEDSAMILRARTSTKPLRQWDVGREFNKRLRLRFKDASINIPSPQMRIQFGPGSGNKDAGAAVLAALGMQSPPPANAK